MDIIVFGASGKTGILLVGQSLDAGHQVTAFVRDPAKMTLKHPALSVVQGEAGDAAAVENAVAGQQAVLSALGPVRGSPAGMMRAAAYHITRAMQKHGVKRLVALTGAGVRAPQDQPKGFDHIMRTLLSAFAREVLSDSEEAVQMYRAGDLDWTVVRVPMLTDGPLTGDFRVGYVGKESGRQISRADAAAFMLQQLEDDTYLHQMPLISY